MGAVFRTLKPAAIRGCGSGLVCAVLTGVLMAARASSTKVVVNPALDAGVHTVMPRLTLVRLLSLRPLMDCRVKPGNDTALGQAAA